MDALSWFAGIGFETLVKATLLLAAAIPFVLLLERLRSSAASMLAHSLTAALLALPFAVALAPETSLPILPAADASGQDERSASASHGFAPQDSAAVVAQQAISSGTTASAPELPPARPSKPVDWATAAVVMYLFGAGWLLVRTAASWRAVARLRQRAVPIDDPDWLAAAARWSCELGLKRPPELRHSNEAAAPGTVAWLRPTVLIPTKLLADASIRDAALLHECCHICRSDAGWQLLSRLMLAAYWFHPLVWVLRSTVGRLREKACDAACAARLGREPYREALLTVAESAIGRTPAPLISMAESCRLEDRLMHLETVRPDATCRAGLLSRWTLFGVTLLTVPLLGGAKLVAASAATVVSDEVPSQPPNVESVKIGGRVLLPNGKPAARADVVVRPEFWPPANPPLHRTKADDEGRWSVSIPTSQIPERRTRIFNVWGWLPGYGVQGFRTHGQPDLANLEIRLVEDRPIKGRIVDEAGKPLEGLKVEVTKLVAIVTESLDPWLVGARGVKGTRLIAYERDDQPFFGNHLADFGVQRTTVTDADGRFEMRGLGAERVVRLTARGPLHSATHLVVLNRDAQAGESPPETEYTGSNSVWNGFQAVVRPGSSVRGVVRDRETGSPIAGVAVSATSSTEKHYSVTMTSFRPAVTNADGRFELLGLPSNLGRQRMFFEPTGGSPYLPAEVSLQTGASGAVTQDVNLDRGIVVQGRVTEDLEGGLISDCDVVYSAFLDNPHRHLAQGYESYLPWTSYGGKFRLVVPPGRGVLTFVMKRHRNIYEWDSATVSRLLSRDATKPDPNASPDSLPTLPVGPERVGAATHNKVVLLDLKPGSPPQTIDVQFVTKAPYRRPPGSLKDVKGIVVGPDGEAISGVEFKGAEQVEGTGSSFVIRQVYPTVPRTIVGLHRGKKLAGIVEVRADSQQPVKLTLKPWGSIYGKLVGSDGKPLPGISVVSHSMPFPLRVLPDQEGRFLIDGLPAGVRLDFRASANVPTFIGKVAEGVVMQPGEHRDLGTVRVRGLAEH